MKLKNRKKDGIAIPVNLLRTVFGIEDSRYTDAEYDSTSNSILLFKKE